MLWFMPVLRDPEIIASIRKAFEEAERFDGYVTWKPIAAENARLIGEGITPDFVEEQIRAHLSSGGSIRFAVETRDEWKDYGFHYDFVLSVDGFPKIYVETVLVDSDLKSPEVRVVSCHKAD
ncbi:MAG: hypothetical protein U0894_01815 [Pirellulales bacterium]